MLASVENGCIFVSPNNETMRTKDLNTAERYRDNAFTNAGKSLMIVMMEGFYYVTNRKEATALNKKGYEVF